MQHRRALAALAVVVCSGTALVVAVDATARVFDAAEASPGVGQVSPVHRTGGPPIVERRVIDLVGPAPAPPSAPRAFHDPDRDDD